MCFTLLQYYEWLFIITIQFCNDIFLLQLSKQEEELRAEEEAYYEAKREAARIAKLQKVKEKAAKGKNATTKGGRSWLGDDENEWEV